MKISLTFSMFCDEWNRWTERKDTFSYNGKRALFDYIESIENDTGEETELDIVSLCGEYSEYDSAMEACAEYGQDEMKDEDDAREWLEANTACLSVDGGGVIIQNF